MKGLFSFIAIACLATVLFLRFNDRLGDNRTFKEKTVSEAFSGMRDYQDAINAELTAKSYPIRLYAVTRTEGRIVLTYTLADARMAKGVASVSSATLYEYGKIGMRLVCAEKHLNVAEILKHRAELDEIDITAKYEDLHGKTLNSMDFNLGTLYAEIAQTLPSRTSGVASSR